MNTLITLDQAKQHLGLTSAHADDDLQLKLTLAHGVIEHYVDQRIADAATWTAAVDAWTQSTAPAQVLAAILLQFGALVRFRGDDDDVKAGFDADGLAHGVAGLLRRLRDPAFS